MMQVQDWRVTAEDRTKHDAQFYQLKPVNGFVTGEQARGFFMQSGLPKLVLGHIWGLADMNGDGKMDKQEFSIAMFLIKKKLQGMELPTSLPPSLKQQPGQAMGGFGGSFTMGMGGMGAVAPAQPVGTMGGMGTMQPMAGSMATGQGGFNAQPGRNAQMSMSGLTMGTSGQMIAQSGPGGFQGISRSATLPPPSQAVHASPERSATISTGPEWSIPHGPKLRYKQTFNTHDKTRSGFLTGPQARQILLQTGLQQGILAQIWSLSDIDNDGRLTQDEFCVSMHLADMAKAGQILPASLPNHLVPPSFRRGRSGSNQFQIAAQVPTSTGAMPPNIGAVPASMGGMPASMGGMPASMGGMPPSQPIAQMGGMMTMTPPMSPGLPQQQNFDDLPLEDKIIEPVSFEDKKRKNFEKGQMELERRRAMLREEQQREKDRQLQIEKQEQEKKDRIRMEQERRRQMELERMMARQREMEAEQEEQRRKMVEQRETARRELERQRQLEIQRQRRQELEAQRIKQQEDVCHLKSKSKTLTCELETLEDKKNSLNRQLSDAKNIITDHHTTIILMGQSRDTKVAEIDQLQKEIQEQRQVKQGIVMQKDDISAAAKKLGIDGHVGENYRSIMNSFTNKKRTLERLREQLKHHENTMETTLLEIDARNTQIAELKEQIPKEQAELERLSALHQQKQLEQQQASTDIKRKSQLASEMDIKQKIAADLQRIRDENQRKQAEEEETRRKQDQIRLAQQRAEQEQREAAEKKKQEEKTKAPVADPFANFGNAVDDPFASSGFANSAPKTVDPADPFAAFSGSVTPTPPAAQKDDPFSAFADFSNAKFDFASTTSAKPSTATKLTPASKATAPSLPAVTSTKVPTAKTSATNDSGVSLKSSKTRPDSVVFKKFRALFAFEAETPEELSINPGDIVMVGRSENAEPGWLGGELNGKTGWFPENYVERMGSDDEEGTSGKDAGWASFGDAAGSQAKAETLSSETMSTSSSAFSHSVKSSQFTHVTQTSTHPAPSPTPGQGKKLADGVKAEALYNWQAKKDNHLSFKAGDILLLKEEQDMWWMGELNGKQGWFPKTQVKQLQIESDKPAAATPAAGVSVAAITSSLFGEAATFKPAAAAAKPPAAIAKPAAATAKPAAARVAAPPTSQPTPTATPAAAIAQPAAVTAKPAEVATPATSEPTLAAKAGVSVTMPTAQPHLGDFTSMSAKPAVSPTPLADQMHLGEEYVTLYPYTSDEASDLHFSASETIMVTKREGDWWIGTIGDRKGVFPANYVQPKSSVAASTDAAPVNSIPADNTPWVNQSGDQGEDFTTRFPYSSDQPGDLNFEAGQTVTVSKKDGDWWTGRIGDREGIFPSNYVVPKGGEVPQIVESPPVVAALSAENAAKTGSLTRKEIARVIAPYTATSAEQLSLSLGQLIAVRKKNPSGWWEGELQARGKKKQIGWFPANYVQIMGGTGTPGTSTPSELGSPTTAISPKPVGDRVATPSADSVCQVITLYPYVKQNDDELSFGKGIVLNVTSKEDKDWWKGELNGSTGVFPANYVQELSEAGKGNDVNWTKDLHLLETTSPMERHRQESIHEVINTEQAYVDDLALAIEVFQKPLGESGQLDVQEISRIFVNWREIIQCNTKLLKSLRVRKKMSGEGKLIHMIGDILCEQLPRMTAYIRFCSCQLNASSLLQQRLDNDAEFKEYIKKLAQDPRVKGMPVSSYLIKPMQRITRYPLLIKKILKYTAESHPDHATIKTALEKAEELCNQVNEGVREKENSDKLEWLQENVDCVGLAEELIFNSLTNCLGPRKYLHSGKLQKTKSSKELYAFLFNDFLLFTTPVKPGLLPFISSTSRSTVEYRMYRQPLFLNEVDVKSASEPGSNDFLFNINHIDKVYALRGESNNDKNRWIDKIQAASKNYIETEKKKREKIQRARSMRSRGYGRLLVVIMEGHDLKPSNNVTGRADPYCEVRMGSQEHKTKVVPDTLSPVWDASMQFTVKDLEQDVLCITVYDRDLFSPNDFLGRTEVRVADVIKEAKGRGPLTKQLLLHEVSTGEVHVKLDLHLFEKS
ncbi:intersectin-1-like [Asterias rubens]|uniref:intersectin-1-like n=1 Tax=Asterias rubens TaxID=7604 RepID=UPI0014554805|nr:intersectin-1-like [Asterias rubens]